MVLRVICSIVAFLLVGAHFFRQGSYLLVAIALLAPLLLFVKGRWAVVLLQILTWAAAVVWIVVAVQLVRQRMALGQPFRGVIIILGVVALFTILTAWLQSQIIQKRNR
jgi:hypothetical protein